MSRHSRVQVNPLVMMFVLAAIIFLAVHVADIGAVERYFDPIMLAGVVMGRVAVIYVMIRKTERWTRLGAGLLATMIGDAALYLFLLRGSMDIEVSDGVRGSWLEIARSLLFISSPFLWLGLVYEWRVENDHSVIRRSDP